MLEDAVGSASRPENEASGGVVHETADPTGDADDKQSEVLMDIS